jgi:predicted nucleic acid-binding Zn ribbon protein
MSLKEPRCLVCGNPLDQGAPFTKISDTRKNEVCSDECFEIYTEKDDEKRENLINDRLNK